MLRKVLLPLSIVAVLAFPTWPLVAQKPPGKKEVIPHGQSQMPGPALSPQEALKKMQVPPGFRVELVAAEPDIVNPVAMTFDERGRIWITESLEYPKKAAGSGRDRVKVLESTRGDGKFDRITTVIEGLNIPSGIAIGHGGVWVANAPDILFYPIEDFAGLKLGKPQVVVTGFGRTDTHELPNSLTWGPDGWLYGLNGVFNHSHVKHRGKEYKFTCALFRIHPKTRDFEIFCEGTSNPWGLAINENGDFFVSACVIDHLWHLVETGYYHRQGGPYPPYTWKIGSIVKHKHQKAAYCGLVWFDSDAYPPAYREKLYMGNIHGNAINCDELTRDGATYVARPALSPRAPAAVGVGEGSNFLLANDAWFMPVAQKVGPDGCLYILDWYDRYHCYQDANRDPAGIDRLKGRLYRVVYRDYRPTGRFDLTSESDEKLRERLDDANVFFRETAQRVLVERRSDPYALSAIINNPKATRRAKLHAAWTLISSDQVGPFGSDILGSLLRHPDSTLRAWAVRAVGNQGRIPAFIHEASRDKSPDVLLQVVIAAPKDHGQRVDVIPLLLRVLEQCGEDKLIPHIVWQNLHPFLEKEGERFLDLAAKVDLAKAPGLAKVLPRAIDRILGNVKGDAGAVIQFIDRLTAKNKSDATARLCMVALTVKVQNGDIPDKQLEGLKKDLLPVLRPLIGETGSLHLEAAILAAALRDAEALKVLRRQLGATEPWGEAWLTILEALAWAGDSSVLPTVGAGLSQPKTGSPQGRARMLAALGRLEDIQVARVVLGSYPKMEPDLQPKAIELLTQRPAWAKALFQEIATKKLNKDVINVNQARRLLATKDAELVKLVEQHWGRPREGRNPEREKVVADMRRLLTSNPRGDAVKGWAVFKKVCAQCHKIHGDGVEVGPDLTSNGRSDFEQLLSNTFDPSLVIGSGYQATTVLTEKGQALTGLLVEDNKDRVVLKTQGGKLETIPRREIEQVLLSKVSLMPEQIETQMQPQEIIDLFAFLTLDRPPGDPKARLIPGTPR